MANSAVRPSGHFAGCCSPSPIAAASQALRGCGVVMLAQFSMAAALPSVQAALPGHSILSSPDCAVLALKEKMAHAR